MADAPKALVTLAQGGGHAWWWCRAPCSRHASFVCARTCVSVYPSDFTVAAMAVDLSAADSELRFQMEEAGVFPATQKKIYDRSVTSLRVFGGLEESREEVRAVFKSDFGLDPVGNIEIRKEISKLLCVWESARMQLKCQEQNRQDAKLGVQQRLVQNTECAAMRAAVETLHGRSLKDREVPSKSLIAVKLEQVEDVVPIAEDLQEVTSLEDVGGWGWRGTLCGPVTQQEPGCQSHAWTPSGCFLIMCLGLTWQV